MSRPKLFLGVTLGRRPDWEDYFAEVVATRSSKPESVAKEIAEKRASREEQAHFYPVAGTIHTCVILDESGREVFSSTPAGFDQQTVQAGRTSYMALTVVRDLLKQFETEHGHSDDSPSIYGLKVRDRLRVMALDAIRYMRESGIKDFIPPGLWYHTPFSPAPWCDPYEAIVPAEHRSNIPYDGLCDFLGISIPEGSHPDTDAQLQAELARQLTLSMQLI